MQALRLMNFFRGRRGITLCPGSGEDWYIFRENKERWLFFPRYPNTDRFRLRVRGDRRHTVHLYAGQRIPETREHIDGQFRSVEVDDITLECWRRALQSPEYQYNYSIWLRDRQPNFSWPRGLDSENGPAIAEELIKSLFMLLITSLFYGGLHMLAWESLVLKPRSAEETVWKLSCLLLMGLGPLAFSVWAGLKAWRGPDAHLHLSKAMNVILGVLGILVSLAYVMARVYLMVEIFLVIPYMDPRVYTVPNYAIYWPHFA